MSATRPITLAAIAVVALAVSCAPAQQAPQIRDARTGKVWTPEPVCVEPSQASSYSNKAFDPSGQSVQAEGPVVQHPRAQVMDTVPTTAGPTVPLMTLDVPSLQVLPGQHWLSILYVTNNSANTVNTVVACHFANGGRQVEDVRVIMPPAGPGERLGVPVHGPRYDIFVDHVACDVITPA